MFVSHLSEDELGMAGELTVFDPSSSRGLFDERAFSSFEV